MSDVSGGDPTSTPLARRLPTLLLALLILAHGVGNWSWLQTHSDPVLGDTGGWDTRWHLRNCMLLAGVIWRAARSDRGPAHVLKEVLLHLGSKRDISVISPNWPRLMYLVAALPCLVLGPSGRVVEMSNLLWLSLLLLSTYLIGAACRDRWCGLLAAVFVSLCPAMFCFSRRFELDFALCAAVAFASWALIRTEGFTRVGWSVAFGVISGLGLLVKAQLLLFLLLPCLFLALREPVSRLISRARGARREGPARGPLLRPLVLASLCAGIAAAISSVWWHGQVVDYASALVLLARPGSHFHGSASALHPFNPLFYLGALIEGVTPLLFIAIVVGALFALRDRQARHRLLLLLWVLGPYVIFSLRFTKQARFLFPAIPALAVLAAIGWQHMTRTSHRMRAAAILIMVVLGGMVQYGSISFSSWARIHTWSWSAPVQRLLIDPTFVPGETWARLWFPVSPDRRQEERKLLNAVDRFLERATAERGRPPRIGTVGHPLLATLGYPYALRARDYFSFRLLSSRPEEAVDFEGPFQWSIDDPVARADYVIGTAPDLVSAEMETRLRQQIEQDVRVGVEAAWQELSAQIRTIRATFTRPVAQSETIDFSAFAEHETPGRLRLYLMGRR
jgi:4-amino-4-deoxy-L-arabinose transferase-like glycosyltransferase